MFTLTIDDRLNPLQHGDYQRSTNFMMFCCIPEGLCCFTFLLLSNTLGVLDRSQVEYENYLVFLSLCYFLHNFWQRSLDHYHARIFSTRKLLETGGNSVRQHPCAFMLPSKMTSSTSFALLQPHIIILPLPCLIA